ncbi:MAG: hypothetical protein ACK5O2_07015 [Microthrixaceae bacterium]
MVIFQAPGGNPGYNQFDSLESAVDFVEQLRNERDVTNARIFALEEVKFEMRPYFRVELQALTTGTGETSSPAAGPATDAGDPPDAPVVPLGASGPSAAPEAPPVPQPMAAAPPAPAPPAPPRSTPAPSAQDASDGAKSDQPTRRGLFGR